MNKLGLPRVGYAARVIHLALATLLVSRVALGTGNEPPCHGLCEKDFVDCMAKRGLLIADGPKCVNEEDDNEPDSQGETPIKVPPCECRYGLTVVCAIVLQGFQEGRPEHQKMPTFVGAIETQLAIWLAQYGREALHTVATGGSADGVPFNGMDIKDIGDDTQACIRKVGVPLAEATDLHLAEIRECTLRQAVADLLARESLGLGTLPVEVLPPVDIPDYGDSGYRHRWVRFEVHIAASCYGGSNG